ncbi:MAG TPA: heavy metal translocating P-type ATPase, partial [Gemmatimonadetes bacterium]|nr:heavy metal translocating P-type ATPase [Gemmatimonadota bacterium]
AQSIVAVAVGMKLLGFFLIDDQLRKDAYLSIEKLRSRGFSLSLFSGDRDSAVLNLGTKLGFHEKQIGWQMLPSDKLNKLNDLKNKGLVAMVGDGINDAPALAVADVGMALGTGTDVAMETADVVLMRGDLRTVSEALALSERTLRTIEQNLFWAFFYNASLIPVAAGVLYSVAFLPTVLRSLHPILAALAMAFSSISVVANSLRLRRVRIPGLPSEN